MAKPYPPEIDAYIRNNYKGKTTEKLTEEINSIFGTNFKNSQIRAYKKNRRLKSGATPGTTKGTTVKYPAGSIEYIKEIAPGRTSKEIAELVNAHFGSGTMTPSQVAAFKKNHKITSGVDTRFKPGQECINRLEKGKYYPGCEKTWFRKGNKPANEVPVGSTSKTTDGYHIIKVKDRGTQRERWEFLHRHIYRNQIGEIPPGYMVGFRDGNFDNLDPENLFIFTNEENLEINRTGGRNKCPELVDTQINIARLRIKTRNIRKERKEG